jgi:hypothetical protein
MTETTAHLAPVVVLLFLGTVLVTAVSLLLPAADLSSFD